MSLLDTGCRCLRLWVRRRNSLDDPPQQIGYVNCVPEVVEQKTFKGPKFLPLNRMVDKMNEVFRANPLPGKIITIETQVSLPLQRDANEGHSETFQIREHYNN